MREMGLVEAKDDLNASLRHVQADSLAGHSRMKHSWEWEAFMANQLR